MTQLDYKMAGVDISAGNEFVSQIKKLTRKTQRREVLSGIGGFAALFELPLHRYRQPILVSATDGVGTKLKLAIEQNQHSTIGIDLVAMCVNDVIVCGAEPLFFLDYFATGQLNIQQGVDILTGIVEGCQQSSCALIGGETAEMPGLYQGKDYDLAGFCVGIVEKDDIIDGRKVAAGDALIGLAASGPHANGYSLIRKILEIKNISLQEEYEGLQLGTQLLTPTKIYVSTIMQLRKKVKIRAMAHITGGGLTENIPRTLPPFVAARIYQNRWPKPKIMQWLQDEGGISDVEMYRTFNCGIGMVLSVAAEHAEECVQLCASLGQEAWHIGDIISTDTAAPQLFIK